MLLIVVVDEVSHSEISSTTKKEALPPRRVKKMIAFVINLKSGINAFGNN